MIIPQPTDIGTITPRRAMSAICEALHLSPVRVTSLDGKVGAGGEYGSITPRFDSEPIIFDDELHTTSPFALIVRFLPVDKENTRFRLVSGLLTCQMQLDPILAAVSQRALRDGLDAVFAAELMARECGPWTLEEVVEDMERWVKDSERLHEHFEMREGLGMRDNATGDES